MKTKYKDVEALKTSLHNHKYDLDCHKENWFADLMEQIIDIIDEQPDADVVEVVRCKDCKYHTDEEPGIVYCLNTVGGWVDENWFCAGGEKKTE